MTGAPPAALLAARGLSWESDGRTVLGPLDVEVRRGECRVVVGPNGAGKTTLLRCLTGLLRPTAGEVFWEGRAFGSLSRRGIARRIAYVPQIRPSRVPLRVEEVVLLGRYPHLSALQLAPRREDFDAVEAALAQEAELLVLDEPTIHLDARHQSELAGLLLRLKAESGRTVVIATHDLNLASLLGDRLLALSSGKVLASGTPAEVIEPEMLERLFRARFEIVRGGERPVTLLRLG